MCAVGPASHTLEPHPDVHPQAAERRGHPSVATSSFGGFGERICVPRGLKRAVHPARTTYILQSHTATWFHRVNPLIRKERVERHGEVRVRLTTASSITTNLGRRESETVSSDRGEYLALAAPSDSCTLLVSRGALRRARGPTTRE